MLKLEKHVLVHQLKKEGFSVAAIARNRCRSTLVNLPPKVYEYLNSNVYVIVFVLSHSRFKFAEWQVKPFTSRDVLRCHESAIQYFGGRTEEIVYDQDTLISVSENGRDIIFIEEFQAYKE